MKLFKTGSAAIISDCQKFFGFLPITYQIDTRTAIFLETFMISDNGICMLFERHAKMGRNKTFSTRTVTSIQCQTCGVPLMNGSSVSHS